MKGGEDGRIEDGRNDEAPDEPAATQVTPPGPTTFAVQTVVIVVSTAPGSEPGSLSNTGPLTTITVTPTPVPSETSPISPDPRTTEPTRDPDPVVTSTSSTPPTSLSEDAGSTAAGV